MAVAAPGIADEEQVREGSAVSRDLQRYFELDSRNGHPGALEKARLLLDTPGLQAVLVYRFGRWILTRIRFAPARFPLKVLYWVLHKLCIICWGIHIDVGAQIGGGLYVGHFGGVVIGPVRMGRDCNVAHQVTIGRKPGSAGIPKIGNRVWIGTGSVVYGDVTIEDGVTIGPLTVVSRSIPPRVLVAGNPMRVIQQDYDNTREVFGAPLEETHDS